MLKKICPQVKEKRIAVKFSDGPSRGTAVEVLEFYMWSILVSRWQVCYILNYHHQDLAKQ